MTLLVQSDADKELLEPLRGLGPIGRSYSAEGIEIRAGAPGSTLVDFYGHASVTGRGYDMYGGPDKGGWTEFVDKGAFKKTLAEKPDTAFLVNHGGMTLARTTAGTLQLAEDSIGLETKAQLDTRVSVVNDLVLLMEAKNLDEMSFAFRIVKQKWLDVEGEEVPWWDLAGIERHLTEVSINRGDVSVVNYGANPFTDGALRGLAGQARIRAELSGRAPIERHAPLSDLDIEALTELTTAYRDGRLQIAEPKADTPTFAQLAEEWQAAKQ